MLDLGVNLWRGRSGDHWAIERAIVRPRDRMAITCSKAGHSLHGRTTAVGGVGHPGADRPLTALLGGGGRGRRLQGTPEHRRPSLVADLAAPNPRRLHASVSFNASARKERGGYWPGAE